MLKEKLKVEDFVFDSKINFIICWFWFVNEVLKFENVIVGKFKINN